MPLKVLISGFIGFLVGHFVGDPIADACLNIIVDSFHSAGFGWFVVFIIKAIFYIGGFYGSYKLVAG